MTIRLTGESAYSYVREPEGGRYAPQAARIAAPDGTVLSRRARDYAARLDVVSETGRDVHVGFLLRAAAAVGRALERRADSLVAPRRVRLLKAGPAGTGVDPDGWPSLALEAAALESGPTHHQAEALARAAVEGWNPDPPPPAPPLRAEHRARRVLFFESLMNSDMPHNDVELSQGVLHMASALRDTGVGVVFANVKMPITGVDRPITGLSSLGAALSSGPVDLVCITLLEGYFEGVERLIGELRRLGCNAHVAVGGVMPTLAPEHVAVHLREVTFVCRGAGEYHVPALARLVGREGTARPFDAAQRAALLAMDGLFAVDRAGRRVVAGNPGRTVTVASLDDVQLNLDFLNAHHLERGVELSTSRGCIHKCAFCSIIGRQSYQARSAEGVFQLLARYESRYQELFGGAVPRNAFRVHVSDDDFACDRDRARTFFENLLKTPFRLASAQVSIADLCARDGKTLLPRVDSKLLDAIRPECFADAAAAIPERDFVADHKSRNWSAYLQIGVETFADAELDRLGKGYDVAHVRAVVAELARRRIHMDAYLILANLETTGADLVSSIEELCRLKLSHPRWFHVRFPIVPRLVSYFTSASYRRALRKGQGASLKLRRHASVPGLPEYDYPFVDADEPLDEWVRRVDESVFTDAGYYTGSLVALSRLFRRAWEERPESRTPARERLLRRLDDRPRRLVFEMLAGMRAAARGQSEDAAAEQQALGVAVDVLGPRDRWLPAFRRYVAASRARLTMLLGVAAESSHAEPLPELAERAAGLLLSSDRDDVTLELRVAGGFAEGEVLERVLERVRTVAAEERRSLSLVVSAEGGVLELDALRVLARSDVRFEATPGGGGAVVRGVPEGLLAASVTLVVLPEHVRRLGACFRELVEQGFGRVEIDCMRSARWTRAELKLLAEELFELGRAHRSLVEGSLLLDARHAPDTLVVDRVGAIRGEDAALAPFGHLDELQSFEHYFFEPRTDGTRPWTHVARATAHPALPIVESFTRWMKESRLEAAAP